MPRFVSVWGRPDDPFISVPPTSAVNTLASSPTARRLLSNAAVARAVGTPMLVLAFAIFALSPAPLLPARRSPLAPRRAACRCAQSMKGFSPAYDTTVRYAAVDWARNLRTLPGSLILRRIKSPLLFNIAITFCICLLHASVKATGRVWPTVIPLPHTLLSSALGLLLVFRTNAAYDRFWEARKQWGIVTTECRALASLACTYMTPQQVTLTLAASR
jgi:hypothetical protein